MNLIKDEPFEIKHDYDVVLIIGNGFDLNFGLKTAYTDFIKSEEFKEIVDGENNLADYLINRNNLQNWIDIENELKTYSKSRFSESKNFFEDFKAVSISLKLYLKGIEINEFSKINIGYKLIKTLTNFSTLIIDFNYTSTLETILKEIEKDKTYSRIDHVKIHGCIEDDNIIFGVEDKADIFKEDVFLKKSVNNNFKAIDFSDSIRNCNSFVVFGHSLGETDHMYFEEFFKNSVSATNKNSRKKNISIYYHGKESYFNIFYQIDNLTSKKITKLKQYNNVQFFDTE